MHQHPHPAPLVVRLRDLGPALSHAGRAHLALNRIRRAVAAEAAEADRAQATDELYRLAAHGERIEEYAPTVEVDTAAFAAQLAAHGLTAAHGFAATPYVPRPRRPHQGTVSRFLHAATAGRGLWSR